MSSYPDLEDSETRRPSMGNRRETILSLVEMLLRPDDLVQGNNQQPSFEDDKDVPTVDEAHQTAGAETFNKFQRRMNNLDKELRNFSNAARQLGSSAGILSSAFHLRTRLAQISYLYRENAANLFPRKVSHAVLPSVVGENSKSARRMAPYMSVRHRAMPHIARPAINDNLDLEDFPVQFEMLAEEVTTFVNCLNEFPEFTDEAVNASISSFQADLRYWGNCLREYEGQFRYPAVQRYIQDLTVEMGEHIDSITNTLSMFIEVGVPIIRFAQKHGAMNLLNLSTVATFFSAVTATTLQFSFDKLDHPVDHAVNSFWFLSLVFSIAAAVNSLLGLTWKQAMYRSPGHRVPWWVLIWIKRSPLVFLVMSVACFSIGLCLFTYSSHQHRITSTITTVITAFTSFGLVAVSTWFASERWAWSRHRGKKWLGDVLDELNERLLRMTGINMIRMALIWTKGHLVNAASRLRRVKITLSSDNSSEKVDEVNELPVTNPNQEDPSTPSSPTIAASYRSRPSDARPSSPIPAAPLVASAVAAASETNTPNPETPLTPRLGRQLWQNAIRTVQMRSQVTSNLAAISAQHQRNPRRQRTSSSTAIRPERVRSPTTAPPIMLVKSRVAALGPKLKCLETTQDLAAHQALVKHLQFSPDGKYLATSSWDRTSVIFRVGDPFESHRILAHAKGFVGQVAWAPDGKLLLTKLSRGIKVWNQDGVCTRTIDRPSYVEAITWFPGGEAFLSVEGSRAAKLDLKGKVLGTYDFGNMKLHDVAVTPDRVRLLGVGPLTLSPGGLRPSKSKVEKRLVVYNMETDQIENITPVLNEVRDITLARNTRNGLVALVSYENKAPPQLWKMEMLKDMKNNQQLTARLTLRHTYMPKATVDFAGPSYFGGKNDELVLCAGKAGDIHIWDRESGALLHYVRATALGGDLTCIAWNSASDNPYMFATGSHDGAIRIWTKPPEYDPPSAAPSNRESMLDITRSSSPYGLEMLERTDSPITQEFASAISSRSGSPESMRGPLIRKDKVVAFVDEPESMSTLQASGSSPPTHHHRHSPSP
ncbi:WD40 repeat-like protein [Dendrothele bispora CBS 962.96]|uniref:WD40 repeat-like protein n=1 Tax=Dendrothele bispora (strain CBS 962.96) TaxID=1314807 RepID=A0A4S8MGS9_DENBC|nr:WD40 repeat-like protein [Dendrothele bispora CBS 962.96]